MRILFNILGGVAVLVLSFWITLQAIDYWPAWKPSDFEIAMEGEGLTMSASITGYVDRLRRDPDGRLVLDGWAFDKELAQPVSVRVLMGGSFEPVAVTKGPREDVTRALRLSPEQTKDVVFSGRTERAVSCESNNEITVVVVNQKRQLSILGKIGIPGCGKGLSGNIKRNYKVFAA